MDYIIVLFAGIFVGWLMTRFWVAINLRWTTSKNLRQSHVKTMKEAAEKGKKAREEQRKARSTAIRAAFETILFGAIVLLLVLLGLSYFA